MGTVGAIAPNFLNLSRFSITVVKVVVQLWRALTAVFPAPTANPECGCLLTPPPVYRMVRAGLVIMTHSTNMREKLDKNSSK